MKLTNIELEKIYAEAVLKLTSGNITLGNCLCIVQEAVLANQEQGEWIPVSEGVTWPCFAFDPMLGVSIVEHSNGTVGMRNYTHFMPITLPPPPKPEISEIELAFQIAMVNYSDSKQHQLFGAFKAGYLAAQSQKEGGM